MKDHTDICKTDLWLLLHVIFLSLFSQNKQTQNLMSESDFPLYSLSFPLSTATIMHFTDLCNMDLPPIMAREST